MASTPPKMGDESVDRSSDRRSSDHRSSDRRSSDRRSRDRWSSDRRSPTGPRSPFGQVGSFGPLLTHSVSCRSTQQDESTTNVIMSDAYRRRADESGVTRYLRVDEDVQFRSQDGGTHRRSWPQASTDDTDMGRHDVGSIGQLLSAVGDGTGGIPLSVAELIGDGTMVDRQLVCPPPAFMSANGGSDMTDTSVITGQQSIYMTDNFGPSMDSYMDARNQRAVTATAGRWYTTTELGNRRCSSPELSEDGQLVYREPRRLEITGTRTSVDTRSTLLNDAGQSTSVILAGVPQQCGGGAKSTPPVCTTVYSCSSFDATRVGRSMIIFCP